MPYGRRVKKQDGNKTEFSFEAHQDVVGEIRLEKNPNDSICNVCFKTETLTQDHVPPQSSGNRGQWKYQSYLNYVTSPNFRKQFTAMALVGQLFVVLVMTRSAALILKLAIFFQDLKPNIKLEADHICPSLFVRMRSYEAHFFISYQQKPIISGQL